MPRATSITKAQGYLNRVFTVEYDLKGMVDAYGVDFMHFLVDQIAENKINCKQNVNRWSAHVALTRNYNFDPSTFMHNDDLSDMDIEDILQSVADDKAA